CTDTAIFSRRFPNGTSRSGQLHTASLLLYRQDFSTSVCGRSTDGPINGLNASPQLAPAYPLARTVNHEHSPTHSNDSEAGEAGIRSMSRRCIVSSMDVGLGALGITD